MSSWTPPSVPPPLPARHLRRRRLGRIAAGLAVVVIVPLTAVAIYAGAWWLRADTVDREVGVQNRNSGTQTAWRDEARHKVEDFQLLDDGQPAKASLRRSACGLIARLSGPYLDDDLINFQAEECS